MIDFTYLSEIVPKYIDLMIDKKLICNGKIGDYYSCESVAEAMSNLLILEHDKNFEYQTNCELNNNEIIVSESSLEFDKNYLYTIYIEGLNILNYGEGDTSNVGHVLILINVEDKWKIFDSFVPFRKLEIFDTDINELIKFIKENEKKLNIDQYNKFLNVQLENSNNITNLDFIKF